MLMGTSTLFVSNSLVYMICRERFIGGMYNRMGDDVIPDLGISLEVMHAMCNKLELDYIDVYSEF